MYFCIFCILKGLLYSGDMLQMMYYIWIYNWYNCYNCYNNNLVFLHSEDVLRFFFSSLSAGPPKNRHWSLPELDASGEEVAGSGVHPIPWSQPLFVRVEPSLFSPGLDRSQMWCYYRWFQSKTGRMVPQGLATSPTRRLRHTIALIRPSPEL